MTPEQPESWTADKIGRVVACPMGEGCEDTLQPSEE